VTGTQLTLLGPPVLLDAVGRPLPCQPGAKALALLAYLLLEPRPHTREELAGLLWGESPDAEARASLRQALKQLREGVGEAIRADRRVVEVVDPIGCDVVEFRRTVGHSPAEAIARDVPRFLAGFSVRHAPRFDEWVADTRAALLHEYTAALGQLSREAMAQWRWRDAVDLADRWLVCDPLSDDAAKLAVESRYLSGDRGAALARFAEYRAALLRETGCEPSRSLTNLVRRVEADTGQVSTRPISDEWYVRAPTFETSLIGRDESWSALTRAWKAAARGQSRVVLLEGEPGVGKSRLGEEFLRWVVAGGGTALRSRGFEARSGIPYAPMVEVLRGALTAPGLAATAPEWLTETARLLPELRTRFPGLPEPQAPADPAEAWRLSEGVAQLLSSVAAERPLAIAFDDLHWFDEDSCTLLRFLVRRLEQSPVLWLGNLTLGELEREAPAARLCRALRAKAQAETLTLGSLGEEDVWRLVREMGHVSTPTGGRRFAGRIFRITGGNPFYIVELLKTMFAQGLLAVDEATGEWTAAPAALEAGREFPLSRSVQDLIAARVERLPGDLAEVLLTVAVAGGSGCRPELLSHVHGISRLRAAALCDALVDRRLVVEDAGTYRAAHPVIGHVVRDGVSQPRRAEVHRMLAITIERLATPESLRTVAGEVARHADRGGEPALACRAALLASEAAMQRYAFAEALAWLDLAAGSAGSLEQTAEVNRRTADVLEVAGWSEVPATVARAIPVTREIVQEDLDLPVKG
ncbi:MAG TPA: AAA family ATPase, partial [Gemmatimonadales bacterium]|nr:AAA family ATPase [Gemmatimonadales bacterium]